MKIRGFNADQVADENPSFSITFGKPNSYAKNSFSILIGPNGTRKSRTLRDVIDLSLLRPRDGGLTHKGKIGEINLWPSPGDPKERNINNIVAISGVASDRFPSRITGRRIRGLPLSYAYVGPRSENNLVSRAHSINQVARSLLEQAHSLDQRRDNLREAFKILNLHGRISFVFRPSDAYVNSAWTERELRKRISIGLSNTSSTSIKSEEISPPIFERCIDILAKPRSQIRFDLDTKNCIRTNSINLEAIKSLIRSGALSVHSGTVETIKGETLNLYDFSSGQWQVLSSLLFAATVVEDGSLMLIDEPENSLHPAWQQQYLPLLRSAISCAKGVHVIVATHFPLIAASLSPEEAEVISLNVKKNGRISSRKLKADPFGWTSDAILEEVFGLPSARSIDFTTQMNEALGLMAKGDRKNSKLASLVRSLNKVKYTLPEDDVAREIIASMAAIILGTTEDA